MNIAVTGASGHIGVNLCRQLMTLGHSVTVLNHKSNAGLDQWNLPAVHGDLLDMDSLNELVAGADVVFHLAATIGIHKKDPVMFKTNLTGTENVLKACKQNKVKRLIHFSSIHAYRHEPTDRELNEGRALDTESRFDYVRSKALATRIILKANSKEIETIVLVPTAVIGPYDYRPSLLGDAIIRFYNHKTPALIPGGYNWVDVRDVSSAAIRAIDSARPGQSYILAGHWKSLRDLASIIHREGGATPPFLTVPMTLAKASAPFLNLYSRIMKQAPLYTSLSLDAIANGHKNISYRKAREELGYQPRPFEKTVADTVNWLKNENFI